MTREHPGSPEAPATVINGSILMEVTKSLKTLSLGIDKDSHPGYMIAYNFNPRRIKT